VRDRQSTHTYWEDIDRQALEWAFLGGGSAPWRLEEDAPTNAAMAIAELSRTYRNPERWVNSVNVGRMLIPFLVKSFWQEVEMLTQVAR
jgi:hypothetical protein